MTLQNRIDPWGRLVADPSRGTFTGNRGIIHNDNREIVRPYASKAWITCVLSWQGRRREVMVGRKWTELFFLDEAVALAAGHRPCGYCRRTDYNRFVAAWSEGNPELAPTSGPKAPVIDNVLHAERLDPDGSKRLHQVEAEALPVGAMFAVGDTAFCVLDDESVRPWSFAGYGQPQPRPSTLVDLLTPPSTVNALTAGYHPAV